MKNTKRTTSLLMVLACVIALSAFSSFKEADCSFSQTEINNDCEPSDNTACWIQWNQGECAGHRETFLGKKAKAIAP